MRRSLRDGSEVLFVLFVLFLEASQLCLCQNRTDGGCIEKERQALLKFRDSFDNYSRRVLAWEGKQCCKWKGVKCDAISGHVVTIDLSPETYSMDPQLIQCSIISRTSDPSSYVEEQLTNGSVIVERILSSEALSPSLLELKHLSHLDLSFINFQGSVIPLFLGSMKQLRYLNLSSSCLSGRVPHPLGNLTNLQIIDLGRSWNLQMDDFTWVSHLSSLQYIDMSRVTMRIDINSVMQVILNLPSLLQAHFEDCRIQSSKISHGFVNSSSLPSKLQVLNLRDNFLIATPNALQNMTSLTFLAISYNHLDSVPLWLGKLKFLTHLDLAFNGIYGQIPIAIQNMTSLTFLDISGNNLDPVPLWLGKLKFLTLLDLSYNGISGQIPIAIQNMTSLTFLYISGNNLDSVPLWLGKLKFLTHLDLAHNNISGQSPIAAQNMTSLTFLDISGNNLDSVPLWLGKLKFLTLLDLSYNGISGQIPIAIQNMTSLTFLYISSNNLDYVPLCLGKLKFLTHLDLSRNNISGQIPIAIQNMTSLTFLDISGNNLDSVPLWLGKLKFLTHLDLADNRISGQSPIAAQNMTSLTFLDISINNLDFVPLWLGQLRSLTHLDLSLNKLTGSFPIAIQNITSLEFLDLSVNHLTSAIPVWFIKRVQHVDLSDNQFSSLQSSCPSNPKINCNLNSLGLWPDNKFHGETFGSLNNTSLFIENDIQYLDLSYNEIKDSLENLGQLKNLMYLDLASNSFHGPFPSSFRSLTKLHDLFLKDNQLNGTIPAFFGRFSTLTKLDLSGNRLDGVIPDTLGKLQNLIFLDLSNNSLEGTLKEIHLDNLPYLQDLKIGNNKLSVNLTPNWLPPFQLMSLQLQSCKIETPFPQWLRNQSELFELDLSNTGIWGTVPKWFYQKYLSVLDLSKNKINGQLPTNIHEMMPDLYSLFLGDNLLNGSIPKSLCKLPLLSNLDLSKNKLSSEIPSCLGEIKGIALIDLSSNELTGTISESFCSSYGSNSSLQSLNLSNNSLHGKLPSTLQSCTALEILDLGNNKLHGIIPANTWADSSVLKIIRLRQNNFSGTIPSSLCELSDLQSLDLASNNLIGTIPFCLGNLEGMKSMGFLAPGPKTPTALPPSFDQWDKENVKQVMKGTELDFTKNLKFVVNLDLSNNSLVGFIPEVLTSLTKLVGLNLSHNYLSGVIPSKIGKMKLLESLDVSWNQLTGPLPSSMSSLTYLSHLNLSYNNFSGPIPQGNQFSTFDDSSIYAGNQYLCGEPVLKKCSSNNPNEAPTSFHYEDEDEKEKILFYFVVAIGFMTGFWGIIALLFLNKSLRYVCFRYMEKLGDEIYVAVAIRVARLKRMGLKPW